jgi:uncharacterized protein YaaQ
MKVLLSILDDRSAGRVVDALVACRYGVTRINTHGGFLRRGNATLLVGVEDHQVDDAIEVMRAAYGHGGAPKAETPSGPVFVLATDRLVRM